MDTATLVAPELDIESGRELVDGLRKAGFPLVAALWYFDPGATDWRLLLATSLVDTEGPRHAYRQVQKLIQKRGLHSLDLGKVVVLTPREPMIAALRAALKIPGGGTWLIGNRFNDILIEKAFIYLLT